MAASARDGGYAGALS